MARPKKEPSKAGRPSGEKTRCGGLWTEARYRSFVKSLLRQGTMKWGPIQECKKLARVKRGLYECAGCGEHVPPTVKEGRTSKKNIHVDHINPVVPVQEGFTTWDDCIEGMFSELDNLQLLCSKCHEEKSAGEVEVRTLVKKYATQYGGTYNSWKSMLARCREGHHQQHTYFDRGIDVCDEWKESFFNFLEDMGERPEGTTLDRKDNDKGYYKDNCRWADLKTQANNRTTSRLITAFGETKTVAEWSKDTGLPVSTIFNRLNREGLTEEEAVDVTYVRKTRKPYLPYGDIYQAHLNGLSYLEIGLKFGCHPNTARKIIYQEREKNEQQ